MQQSKCDSKGRLLIRQSLRREYGERFIVVPAPREIVLIPVPADPVQDLREATKKARGRSTKELRSIIERQGRQQVVA